MDDGESEEYQLHLRTCAACTEKISELRFVSDALLSGVPQLTAPPAIRSRVMAVVRAESELLKAAGASADRPVVAKPARRFRLALRPLPAAALASVLLALGIGGGLLLTGDRAAQRTLTGEAIAGTAKLKVGDGGTKLVVTGLPAPGKGRIYQVWLDHPNDRQPPQPTDALFSVSKRGNATVDVPSDLKDVSTVAVTEEPIGGSQIPTGKKVIGVRIT
jgi:hypothetical protein